MVMMGTTMLRPEPLPGYTPIFKEIEHVIKMLHISWVSFSLVWGVIKYDEFVYGPCLLDHRK
jgi:hypothetical protein